MDKQMYRINGFSFDDIRNVYETRVIEHMKREIDGFSQFDKCEKCLRDVYALALSRIPATYASKDRGEVDEYLPDSEVSEIVRYAIFQVIQKPHHHT